MQLKKMTVCLAAGLLMSFGATAENYHWDNVAMGGGGFVSGIVASKSERGVVYARTDVGGAYRYDSRNGRWVALTDWISESDNGLMGVESLAIDPRNAAIVYMLAGTDYASSGKTAILRSTDYGKTFTVTDVTAQFKTHGNGMGRSNGERLQVDPGSSNVLFVGTRHNGLFKSVDSGTTWTHVDGLNVTETDNGNGISFVLLDPASVSQGVAKRIYVGVSRYGSVGPNLYLSKDGGVTFAPVAGAPGGLMPQRAAITNKGRLYLTYANGAGPHPQSVSEPMNTGAIWEYNTIGGAWTNVTPANRTHPFGGISVDPANPKHLIASSANTYWTQSTQPSYTYGDRIYTSLDAGRSWTDLMDGGGITIDANGADWVHSSMIHWAGSIEFDPFDTKSAWVISGNGVYRSSNIDAPNSVWKFDVHGMEETGVYAAESIPGGPLVTAIGDYDGFIQDDPSQYGPRHTPSMGSTTGLAIAPLATNVMARVGSELYTSTNTGGSWEKAPSMMASRGNVALSADGFVLLHSPENSTTIYRSTDAGGSWTAVAGLSVNNARPIADGVNPAKFYVYDSDTGKVMVSTDGGVSFSAQAVLGSGGSTFLRATPGIEGDLWVCLGRSLNHSTDSGATFTQLAGVATCGGVGLGKAAPDASYPTLYMWGSVGTARGLLRSTDKGVSWVRVNDDAHQYGGAGRLVTGDMNTYGTVYMSTNGRGLAYGKIDPAGDVEVVPQVYVAPPKPAECKYLVTNNWWGGGIAEVDITNKGTDVIRGWTVSWTYADKSTVGDYWNGTVTGTTPTFNATPTDWNHDIYPGQTASVGFVFGNESTENPVSTPVVTGDVCK
ncbi:cellulose binding domain-containing protein [Massilia orientalis]|uniref:Cellulose binding domain-containing protein n=1 Tax=Massilia orientalis TaxID=3050128 RepID=A0ACC7MAB6_9BURK|nr:cellulose binding domain-containing protein [Massilia sp. YIM B02787]